MSEDFNASQSNASMQEKKMPKLMDTSVMTMAEFEEYILENLNKDEEIDVDGLTAERNEISVVHGDKADEVSFAENSNEPASNVIALRAHHGDAAQALHQDNHQRLAAAVTPVVPVEPSIFQAKNARVDSSPPSLVPSMPDGYAFFDGGIYQLPADETLDPIFVCSPLRVDAVFSDLHGSGHGKLVSIKRSDGQWVEIPIMNAELHTRPTAVIATLTNLGLDLAPGKESKKCLIELIITCKPATQLRTAKQMGWVDSSYTSFCVGNEIIGRSDMLPLLPATVVGAGSAIRGSVESWKSNVGILCRGNPLMILAASLAFSGSLLAPLNMEPGGLHFRGVSSSGKTTLLRIAASVWGSKSLITQWRATSNGLEAVAVTRNDMLLPLDEIDQIHPQHLYDAIYSLGNGVGKTRLKNGICLDNPARWRLAMISSGEISTEEKLKEGRLEVKAGQEVRLIDVEADSRAYGAFDMLNGAARPEDFADTIKRAVEEHHGAPGHAFVERLIGEFPNKFDSVRATVRHMAKAWVDELPGAADGQIARVATLFATIGMAGELATQMGLTGWDRFAARNAAKQAFFDWYDRRYGAKREAVEGYVKLLQQFLTGNFSMLTDLTTKQPSSPGSLGWRDATRVYLTPETWSTIFAGVDGTKAAKALIDMQMLEHDGGRFLRKAPRAISGRPRLYTVQMSRVIAYKPG